MVTEPDEVVRLFIDGSRVVASAIADPLVGDAWGSPSVLEGQLVSGLAGHLARGGVWVVADYLDAGTPEPPVDFASAGEYFASFAENASPEDHRAVRDRGAAVASVGHEALVQTVTERLDALESQLRRLDDPARLIAVIGARVMRLHDYLTTRIVEQIVHLDDLARSIGRETWRVPSDSQALVISVGMEMATLRHGPAAVVRALYRQGFGEQVLPVL
jgi:hypothetical protein